MDQVRRDRVHGSVGEIQSETLKILKVNKKRFNETVERRSQYQVGNILTNMIANEDKLDDILGSASKQL